MRITLCGAAQTVTGSCFWIKTDNLSFLVDCGMFQGPREVREKNEEDFLFNPAEIDFVLLTHAHIDHSGLIPRLFKQGFKGKIICTSATADLCGIMLPDSGHIQEMEIEWRNRKRARLGEPPIEPLYTAAEAHECLNLFDPVVYHEMRELGTGVRVRFVDAGHILGSAIIELWVEEDSKTSKLVFSGDLGQNNQPIIRDPSMIEEADYVFVESTYGTRNHEDRKTRREQLLKFITESVRSGGNLVIPAFAVGRTQDLLYHINILQNEGKIPSLPVFIDSPMAISATETFRQHAECFDRETAQLLYEGESPFELANLNFTRTVDESRAINEVANGAVIISASGMCEAGRILHHLKHNLWRPESHILFVGYQAEGTLGRRILEGAEFVKLFGEEVAVKAQIHSIEGFSAHADQQGLLSWLSGFSKPPKKIFLVHGEPDTMALWGKIVETEIGVATVIPAYGDSYDLGQEELIQESITSPFKLKQALLRTVHNLEADIAALRGRVQQQVETMEPNSMERLMEFIKEIQSNLYKVGK